jgi:hypothetical protein
MWHAHMWNWIRVVWDEVGLFLLGQNIDSFMENAEPFRANAQSVQIFIPFNHAWFYSKNKKNVSFFCRE